ncbi:MAG: hypothetical protein HeimC2_43460 [Candidatus Heimdallarchaeota archaeon LC_2]|nr:MAG: hypothetical protein HeimC2_43460 [Candidatus Heimdallarchaeota archaeon LC_2]
MTNLTQQNTDIDQFFEFHLKVLKLLLNGEEFSDIAKNHKQKMIELDYIDIAKRSMLSFDSEGTLIGAYPISLNKSPYKVKVEGIGEGYSMCAVDALGVAYTFNAKTTIVTKDFSTNERIEIIIDPRLEKQKVQDFVVTYGGNFENDGESCDLVPALSLCPTIHFYSNPENIENSESINIISFDKALKSAKDQFSISALKSCVSNSIEKNSESTTESKIISADCCNSESSIC